MTKRLIETTPIKKLTKKEIFLNGPKKIGLFLIEQGIVIAKLNDMDYKKIESEMCAKDYNHLLKTFKKYFDKIIDYQLN